jgi:hypothetical protein
MAIRSPFSLGRRHRFLSEPITGDDKKLHFPTASVVKYGNVAMPGPQDATDVLHPASVKVSSNGQSEFSFFPFLFFPFLPSLLPGRGRSRLVY